MKLTRAIGRAVKPFVNVPRWLGISQLRANAAAIVKMMQDLRIHRPPVRKEEFNEAMERLNLSEEDIKQRMKTCLLLSILYSTAALLFLIYTVYMILHGHLGMILGLLITVLMSVFAYREHFWYFQMKTRSLGNSFKGWVHFLFRGNRK